MEITEEKPEVKVKNLIKKILKNRLSYLHKGTQVYLVKDFNQNLKIDYLSVYIDKPKVQTRKDKKTSWTYESRNFQLWEPLTPAQAKQLSYSKIYLWEV